MSRAPAPALQAIVGAQDAHARAHDAFLRVSRGSAETLERIAALGTHAGAAGPQAAPARAAPGAGAAPPVAVHATPAVLPDPAVPVDQAPPRTLDREACLEFAIGSIGRVLGPRYAAIDAYPTRVRLPDEPLMLVDRITLIEGEAGELGPGRVVTEHDVHADRWYLDSGRIPTALAVESGQADLFLSGYLGIDHRTRGLAVYRLLDAEVTFHDGLPRPGDTIRYDIHIDEFFRQDETHLFRFRFLATVDGRPLLEMRNGCAGFFTPDQLEAGRGLARVDAAPRASRPSTDDVRDFAFVPLADGGCDAGSLARLRAGDLAGCFGAPFERAAVTRALGLPSGRLALIHRVPVLEPGGGPWGLGRVVGETDIHPDDWFLTCHFVDDQVMPGTLMYESCLQTLRVFALRLGWVGEAGVAAFEPIPGEHSSLKCRGQVTARTAVARYEVLVKSLGFEPDTGAPFARADAVMYADGRPIVRMINMTMRLGGVTRDSLRALWADGSAAGTVGGPASSLAAGPITGPDPISGTTAGPLAGPGRSTATGPVADDSQPPGYPDDRLPAIFDRDHILEFAQGQPSRAFGERYRPFDRERKIARLPALPYAFIDRITGLANARQWRLEAGAKVQAQYLPAAGDWYFAAQRAGVMPYSVLLEVALQPCGWLAAYLGAALLDDSDLWFRNLGGTATPVRNVTAATGPLTTHATLTKVSRTGPMIIVEYRFSVGCAQGDVLVGETYFGFFTAAALAQQVGIRDALPRIAVDDPAPAISAYPVTAPYPDTQLRMVDAITHLEPDGGSAGAGYVRGTSTVDPGAWFFAAHFKDDPVWPGSLGLESMLQILHRLAGAQWDDVGTALESPLLGVEHEWIYRGQILPGASRVVIEADVRERDDDARRLIADGLLIVDGVPIYRMRGFGLKV